MIGKVATVEHMQTLRFHPVADVFPLMGADEYRSLVDDIREHGLLEPIVRYEGQILDGRNRYRACLEADVTPHFQDWAGECGSPAHFVWSKNAERRQLTTGQRALAGVALMPYLEAVAKERQREHGGTAPGKHRKTLDRTSDQVFDDPFDIPAPTGHRSPRAADYAGKLVGVDASTIYQTRRLVNEAEHNPAAAEMLDQVKAGAAAVWGLAKRIDPRGKPTPAPDTPAKSPPQSAVTREIEEEIAAERRRSRAYAPAGEAPPPPEDADESVKAMHTARPARSLLTQLVGVRMDMARQNLSISPEALDAWWTGVEPREWERVQETLAWLNINAEPLLSFLRYKVARHSVPPMVKRLERKRDQS